MNDLHGKRTTFLIGTIEKTNIDIKIDHNASFVQNFG